MGPEGRKQEEAGAWLPQPGQGAESRDTDRLCRTGLDTAGGCETRAIPWRRDLSLAALRSPGCATPAGRGVRQLSTEPCTVSCGELGLFCWNASNPAAGQLSSRHAGGHSLLSEHSQDAACQELLPSRSAGKLPTLCPGWMEHHGERKGDELPPAFAGRRGPQEGSQAAGLQAETLSSHSPQAARPQGQSVPASNILLHPSAHGYLSSPAATGHCCEGPHPGTSRVPATPLHQPHGSHPQAREIHMSGALQQHKGSSLLAVGIRS